MAKKFSNPLMDGIVGDPSRQFQSTNPINPILQNFGKYVDKRIPSTDDSNRGIDLSKYSEYLGNSFVFTGASDKNRAINQPTGEQVRNAVLRILPNTALEFMSMTANALDLEDYVNSNNEVGNWLTTWAQERKQAINEALPIYRKEPTKPLDIGDTAWWMENGTNLVQSAGAFVGLGFLTGGAISSAVGKGAKYLKWLQTLSNTSPKVVQSTSAVLNSAILNQAEGIGIATETFDKAFNKKLGELQADSEVMKNSTPEQIEGIAKKYAASAAASAINFNRINILTNITSAGLFIKTPILSREVLTAPSIGRSFKRILGEGFQESSEEGINLVAEKQALSDTNYTFENAIKDVATREGAENMLMGFIGGAGQTGLTLSGRLLPTKRFEGQKMSENQVQRERFVAQQEQIARWDKLSKAEKMQSATDAFLTLREQSDLKQEINTTIENKDFKKAKELSNKLLTYQASDAFNTGTTEQLIRTYEALGNMSQEEATTKGYYNNEPLSDPNHYKNKSKKAIDTILKLEDAWNSNKDYINHTPVYEGNGEVKWNGVYTNRAESIEIENTLEEVERIKDNTKKSIEEILVKMGVEDDAYQFNSLTGELSIIDTNTKEYKASLDELKIDELKDIAKSKGIKKYYSMTKDGLVNTLVELNETSKATAKSLLQSNSYKGYQNLLNIENSLKAKSKELEAEYVNLTSDKTQKDILNYYKQSKKDITTRKAAERKAKTKETIVDTKNKIKQTFSKEATQPKPKSTVTTESSIDLEDSIINTTGTFKFTAASNPDHNTELNRIYNLNSHSPEERLGYIKLALKDLFKSGTIDESEISNLKQEYSLASKRLKETPWTPTEITTNSEENKAEVIANELLTLIESDDSPKLQEAKVETPADKAKRKANLMIDLVFEAEAIGIKDFKSLAIWMNGKFGSERFAKNFIVFQDLYNGALGGQRPRANFTYTGIFATNKDKKDFVDNDNIVNKNSLPFGVYTIDNNNLDNIHKATITKLAQQNALDIEGKNVDFGDVSDGVYKVVFGHNKIGYLARNYIRTMFTDKNGNVVVRKNDIDNSINEISDELLDYSKLKVGDKITLVPLSSVTYEEKDNYGKDVTKTVNFDGTIQYSDGRTETRNPQEVAPIGIMYNGKLLTGAFLHIADWINEESIVGDVELDRSLLVEIRRAVLNAGEEGITTEVTKVSPGWLMTAVDNEGKVVFDTTANNLPDVTTFGIKKDGIVHTGYETTTSVINNVGDDGTISAIVDISDTAKLAIALNRKRVNSDYAASIKNAVRIFITQDSASPVVKQMEDNYGINILSMEGLKDYIGRFIFTYNNFEGDTDTFKTYLKEKQSNVYLVRLTNNSIEFGRGQGIQFNSISKNSPKGNLETFLNNLEKHLLGTYMNMDITRLNTTNFSLPIIKDGVVKGDTMAYNDYIKNHTETKFFSTKTESGKPIYTIQKTFEFNTKGILEEVVDEELKNEVIGGSDRIVSTKETSIKDVTIKQKSFNNGITQNELINNKTGEGVVQIITPEGKVLYAPLMGNNFIESLNKFSDKTIEEQANAIFSGIPISDILNKLRSINTTTHTITSPTGRKININPNEVPPDESPKLVEVNVFDRVLSNIPSNVYIKGMGFNIQNSIIDYITTDVLGKLVLDGETTTSSELLQEYIKMFQEYKTMYEEAGNEVMAELAQQVIDNGKDIISIVTNNLAKMDITDVSLIPVNDESGLEDSEGTTERQSFDSEAIFKVNPISSLTGDIKRYLSAVFDIKVDENGKPILNEKGGLQNKTGVFGLDVSIPFDVVINDLYAILANTNEQYVPPIFDVMMDKIKEHSEAKPYLENVLLLLKEAPENIKYQFVTAMSKHYTHHKYIYKVYDTKTKSYRLIPMNSDSFSNQEKVLQDWNNRLKSSKYIQNNSIVTEDLVIVNKEQINEEFNNIVKGFKESKPIVIDLRNWLNDLGIKISDTVLVQLKNKGYFANGSRVDMEYMLTGKAGVFNLINQFFVNNKNINDNNPFKDKAVKALAKEVAKSMKSLYSQSFSDVEGETYFGYSPNKYFIERYQNITNDLDLLLKLNEASFSKTSSWLKELLTKNDKGETVINTNSVFYRNFRYSTSDGSKDQKTQKGKKLKDMSPAEHELYKLGLFFNQGGSIGNLTDKRIMTTLYPTISDKSLMYELTHVGYNLTTMSDGNISKINPIWDILYDTMVQSEINRITEFQANKDKYNIKGFDKGAEIFYFIPELNNLESLWEDGNLKYIVKNSAEYKLIIKEVQKHISSLVEEKKSIWRNYGFVDKNKKGLETVNIIDSSYAKKFPKDLSNVANNYVINNLLANVNTSQLFTGDPALFFKVDGTKVDSLGNSTATKIDNIKSTFINQGVRLSAHIAPGLDIPALKGETFTTVYLKDREGDISINKEYLKRILDKEDYEEYNNVAGTDAQEYTTLAEHLDIMLRQGRITKDKVDILLDREEKGLELDIRLLTGGKDTLQPMKLVYMNKVWDGNMEKVVYVKSSSYPLIKQLTRGLEIDKLREAINRDKVSRVAFSTAVKLGNVKNSLDIFNTDGIIKDNLDLTPHIQILPRSGHRRQLEVPFDENSYKINDGTQQSKLLFTNILDVNNFVLKGTEGNLTGSQLRDKFNDTYGQLFKIRYKNLMEELIDDSKKLDLVKIQNLLYSEGIKRNFSINDLQSISLVERNGKKEFIVPLWATASAAKFESLLSSIVDNRIRKRIVNGKSYVLGSEEGYQAQQIKEVDTIAEALKYSPDIVFDEQWLRESGGKLRPMREENGKIMPDEVLLPMKFYNNDGKLIDIKQFINKDGFLDVTRIDPQLLEQFGFRIPTQGHNSMTYIRVVGFLPYESGDLIITPRDFTKRMGSDFDVDKLYVISYNTNYDSKNGIISRVKKGQEKWSQEKQLQDELLDIHFAVLGNTDLRIQKQVHTPLGFGLLEQLANDIDNAYQDSNYVWSALSDEYQKNRYLSARGAGIGVGAFSLDNTFNSLLQGHDEIVLMTTVFDEEGKPIRIPYELFLGGRRSNDLSNPLSNTKGKERFKSDIISAYQSASVDNEKVQLLNRLNINKHTFSTIKLLNQLGFEEDVVMYFINQPIIRDYTRLMTLAQDNTSNWNVAKVEEEMEKLYPSTLTDEEKARLSNISLNTMRDMLHDRTNKDFNNLQQSLFYRFLETSKLGGKLGEVQSAINSDSAGVGKDLFYSLIKENQILDLINNGTVRNAHKLIGEYWSPSMDMSWKKLSEEDQTKAIKDLKAEGYVQTRGDLFIKPTTINGYASIYGTLVNVKLWNKLFGYDSVPLLKTLEQITNVTSQNSNIMSVKAEAYRKAWNFVKSYLMSQSETLTEGSLIEERNRLLYDTETNMSLASIVDDIKDKGLLKNNPFINRLETDIYKVVLPSKLTYNSSLEEGNDERYIHSGFIDLLSKNTILGTYNGIEYTTKTLAQDLVTHQFITGGVQKANQFIKYIPVQYLNELGYYDMIKSINLKDRKTFKFRKKDTTAVTEQYVQHYPREVANYSAKGFKYNENESELIIENEQEFTNTTGNPIYLALPSDKAKSKFKLYKKFEDKYIQLDTLGDKDLRETDFYSYNAKTTILSNKSAYTEPKKVDLPSTEKGVKGFNKVSQKETFTDVKEVPPESVRGMDYEYGLREDVPGIKKLDNALNHIINKSDNKFYKWYAKQLLDNIGKLPIDLKLTVDITLESEGRTNYDNTYKPTGIIINPLNIDSREDFERVILHELTHAMIKEAIYKSGNNETIQKLRDLHIQFQTQMRHKYTDSVMEKTMNEIKSGGRISIKIKDARIIRAAMDFDEFITEAMSNKDVQNALNSFTPNKAFKNAWEDFKSLVADILEAFGFSKGKALDYVVSNVISLIDSPKPSADLVNSLTGKETRTVEWVNNKYGLIDEEGKLLPITNPEEVKKFIEDSIDNIDVEIIDNKYVVVTPKDSKKGVKQPVKLFNKFDKELKKGSIVEYNGKKYLFWNKTNLDKAQLIQVDGTKFSGTPNLDKLTILGSYPTVSYNNIDYIVTDNDNVYSGATGNLVYTGNDNSSKTQKQRIIDEAKNNTNFNLSIADRVAQDNKADELPVSKLLKARRTRIRELDRLISKSDSNNEFAKAEDYKQQKQELIDSIEFINKYTTLENYEDSQGNIKPGIQSVAEEDLAEVSNMLDKDLSVSDILYALKITNLWEKGLDIFFDDDTMTSESLRNLFKNIQGSAEYYSEILYGKLTKLTNDFIKSNTGIDGEVDVEKIMASVRDMSKLGSVTLNIDHSDNILLNAVFTSVKKAEYDAKDEAREIMVDLDKLLEKISPVLGKKGEKYDMFRQKFKDGLHTGNLIGKFTAEFQDVYNKLNFILDGITDGAAFKRHVKKRKEKLVTFDVRKLFPEYSYNYKNKYTKEEIDNYKQELKSLLGENTYNTLLAKQQRMLERYIEDREHNKQRIISKYKIPEGDSITTNVNAVNEFKTWIFQNSPYEIAAELIDEKAFGVEGKFITPVGIERYLIEVPRKADKDGKDLGFYDENFSTIENNEDLLEFYNYIVDVFDKLKIYAPQSVQEALQLGGLPEISKTLLELSYDVKSGKETMSVIWDELRKSIRTEDISDVTYADTLSLTGKPDHNLSLNIMKNNKQFFYDYIDRKSIEYRQAHPDEKTIPTDISERWEREARHELAQKKSYDLGKVVKAYSMLVLGYKHKSRIEDQLKMVEVVIDRSKEMILSAKKKPLVNEKGEIQYKEEADSFVNMKSSLEYYMDTFYGQSRKMQGITDKEILTSEEKLTKEEIENLLAINETQYADGIIKEDDYTKIKEKLQTQLDNLGGVKVWSKVGDNILKYHQLKVMGWNLFSGFNNIGFGWISNFIEAADGRVFNQKELLSAYGMVLHSVGKNLSFGGIKSDTATKIRSLMDRFDFLKDMSNEMYKNSLPSQFSKGTRWLSPYNITQRTEYINQAPILIAMMNRTKTENGESLWEQFDKDGNWIGEGEYPTELITRFRLASEEIRDNLHGDYTNPLKIKEKVLGRAMAQFRTWMFEGFAERFYVDKYDPILGIYRKARYKSFSPYFKKLGAVGGMLDLVTNLLRKLTFQGTKFDNLTDAEIFNEADSANMRKILSEITIYISLISMGIMLKMFVKGSDDDDKDKKQLGNYLINIGNRLETDIVFYFNPIQFRQLLRDPVPVASLIKDVYEWVAASGKFVIGKDIISTGVYSGKSRLGRETMQLLPFGTQIYRNIAASKTQY